MRPLALAVTLAVALVATVAVAIALTGAGGGRFGMAGPRGGTGMMGARGGTGMMGARGGMGMMGPLPSGTAVTTGSPAALYQANCAVCHGAARRGLVGPALLPSTLTRDDAFYVDTITNGRPGTAMPAWGARGLTQDQIRALVAYLKSAP
jgi:mono/diheme cytochrome c family protein